MDEFSQTGWADVDTADSTTFDPADYPAAIIHPSRDGDSSIHDVRGVPELNIDFELDYDFIDLTLSLAKYGVESDTVVVDGGPPITVPGAGEGLWNRVDLEIPFLAEGSHTITITLADSPAGNGAHVWDALMLTGDQVPTGEITSPNDGEILFVGETLELGAVYHDDDQNGVSWAVRQGSTCATGTVAGNVDGFNTSYDWDVSNSGAVFSSAIDTLGWNGDDYCFIFNPVETGNETDMRLTREFRIADGYINGGGQIIQDSGGKKPYKVSFGGELWRFGSTVECNWTVQFHKVSESAVSGGKFQGSSCTDLNLFTPTQPETDGVVNFKVNGSFNGESAVVLFRMEDRTEPAAVGDTIRMELWVEGTKVYDTSNASGPGGDFVSTSDNVGTARTELDRGNLQIDMR